MTKLCRSEESMLPRYSEKRVEAIIRAVLRDAGEPVTASELIAAVARYRGERHRELVAMGVCSPTRHDVCWALECMAIMGTVDECERGYYALGEGK